MCIWWKNVPDVLFKPLSLNIFSSMIYCQITNISHTLIGDKIVYHSDVVGAWPVGAAPTTSSFST